MSEFPEFDKRADVTAAPPRFSAPRLSRLAKKELRETLRDRRTIITLILMPLLVYPILSLVFRTFLLNTADSLRPGGAIPFSFVVDGDAEEEQIVRVITLLGVKVEGFKPERSFESDGDEGDSQQGSQPPQSGTDSQPPAQRETDGQADAQVATNSNEESDSDATMSKAGKADELTYWDHKWNVLKDDADSLEQVVQSGQADAGIRLTFSNRRRNQIARYELIYDPESAVSRNAAQYVKDAFSEVNYNELRNSLRARGLPSYEALQPIGEVEVASQSVKASGGSRISLASLIPLILVLMTITGAVYPAIDLTAGERERGTLETLMAAPVPRMGILFSKFVAVLTVAVLTATLNIIGMVATVWAFGLDDFFGNETGLTLMMVVKIFGLLILFASFFSAILLAVTSYARSFKEAQSYLIPIILLSMAPGLMAMTPGLTLAGPLCVTPMVNLLLLARDVLQQNVQPIPSLIAVVSTVLYTGFAILAAAKIFGSDAILYGSQGSWSDMYQRPKAEQPFAPAVVVALCLVLLFPLNFVMIAILGRFGEMVQLRLGLMGLFTFLSFVVLPWMIARHQRINTTSGFGLLMPRPVFMVAAVVLGLTLWPIVMSLISLWHDAYAMLAGAEQSGVWHDQLVEKSQELAASFRQVPPLSIALSLALIPAICEEWFFRGFLLRGLLIHMKQNKWKAIFLSAVIFGLFHTLSGSVVALDRLIPTMLIGIALGYLAYKSNSIVPGIILHMIHNGIVAFLAYYQPQLSRLDWFPKESEPIPYWWVLVALGPAVLGVLMIALARRTPMETEQ